MHAGKVYLAAMLEVTVVRTEEELLQIHRLNQENLRQNLHAGTQDQEGFVSWLYSVPLLAQMHELAPSVIVREGGEVVGYALTTLREARAFHADLDTMFRNLQTVQYRDKPLSDHSFYCMGQICVAKTHRGRGLVDLMYQKHRELYSDRYAFILTEISTGNQRSQKAHEKTGFQTIHTYRDGVDEWNVVVWEWLARTG